MLSAPLRDRFGAVYRLDFYDVDSIARIIRRNVEIMDIPIEDDRASSSAPISRGRQGLRIGCAASERLRAGAS